MQQNEGRELSEPQGDTASWCGFWGEYTGVWCTSLHFSQLLGFPQLNTSVNVSFLYLARTSLPPLHVHSSFPSGCFTAAASWVSNLQSGGKTWFKNTRQHRRFATAINLLTKTTDTALKTGSLESLSHCQHRMDPPGMRGTRASVSSSPALAGLSQAISTHILASAQVSSGHKGHSEDPNGHQQDYGGRACGFLHCPTLLTPLAASSRVVLGQQAHETVGDPFGCQGEASTGHTDTRTVKPDRHLCSRQLPDCSWRCASAQPL